MINAEASKDVVDFLFSLLTLPLATVVKILTKDYMIGSVGNLYGSVEKLDSTYLPSADAKAALLSPAGGCKTSDLLRPPAAAAPAYSDLYECCSPYSNKCYDYVSTERGRPCPIKSCAGKMTTPLKLLADEPAAAAAPPSGVGFVQGIVTYTVMDDLKVAPMSTISGITLLSTFGITDIGTLQEKTVHLGYEEGLKILKASLQSTTVLTDVFIVKKKSQKA
ncbi:hypothetical protein ACP4OV_022081 [Aristida adscensionis]